MANDQKSGSKIQWGTIIAGAAILTGAMLFFPGVMDSVANLLSGLFTPAAAAPMSAATKAVIGKVAGASLLGGGVAYVMSGKNDSSSGHHHHHEEKEGFQDRLAIDRANNMMVMRAAYAGNPQAQQMLMNQQGR